VILSYNKTHKTHINSHKRNLNVDVLLLNALARRNRQLLALLSGLSGVVHVNRVVVVFSLGRAVAGIHVGLDLVVLLYILYNPSLYRP
jgi:hypothetical protein